MNNKAISALLSLTTLISLGGFAQAEPVTNSCVYEPVEEKCPNLPEYESVQNLFWRASTNHSGDFFDAISFEGQANTILGFNGFPENQISKDVEIITILTYEFLDHQTNQIPLRTRDLNNPYQSSLQEYPSYYIPFSP